MKKFLDMLFSFTHSAQNHVQWRDYLLFDFLERFYEFSMDVLLSYLLNVASVKLSCFFHFLFRMDKFVLFVVLLFYTNLAVANPIMLKRISGQLKTDFKTIDRVDSIPGKCEEIEICELIDNSFRLCKKTYKCTQ